MAPNKIQICSIDPLGFPNIKRTYSGGLDMPPCPKDKPYVSRWYQDEMDEEIVLKDYWLEHAKHIPVPIPVREVVDDIMNTENMINRGCFIPKGETPTEEELEAAHRVRIAYMEKCIQAGDMVYSNDPKRIDEIPQEYKRYAAELKVHRPWAYHAPKNRIVDCPACGGEINFGVAICKHCKAILDVDKAKAFGLVQEKKEPVAVEKPVRTI